MSIIYHSDQLLVMVMYDSIVEIDLHGPIINFGDFKLQIETAMNCQRGKYKFRILLSMYRKSRERRQRLTWHFEQVLDFFLHN